MSRSRTRGSGAACRLLPGEFKQYLAGIGIAGIGDFSNTLLILWATQAWTPQYGLATAVRMAMLFYVGYNVVYVVFCWVSGLLADHVPKHWVLASGYALAVVPAIALLVSGDSFMKFAVAFGVSGLYMGVWETLESSTAATVLPEQVRGIGFGVLSTVNGIGDFLSSLIVGVLWGISPPASMGFVIATSLAGAAIIARTGATSRT
jgi:MFS family permease